MADEDELLNETPEAPEEIPEWPGAKPKQAAFLTALVTFGGRYTPAAKAAKISRATHYVWLDRDEHYRMLHARAMTWIAQVLEDEAIRRAKEGVKRDVYYQGEVCGTETVYSDEMLRFLLRAAWPEKYGEKKEIKGDVNVHHKFSGTMEELLATYRKLTSEAATE